MTLSIAGIDPGYANGGFALRRTDDFILKLGSLPTTIGEIPNRVDQAAAWFIEQMRGCAIDILAIENQHGAAHGASRDKHSDDKSAWVREVVGGVRLYCRQASIPIRLVEPQGWRCALGLPPRATKKAAWERYCKMCHAPIVNTNEHSRDALVIAYAGSKNAHLWLMEHRRKAVAA